MCDLQGGSGGGGGRIWLGLAFERRGHSGRPPSSPPEVLPTPPAPLPEPPPTFRKSKWSFKPELIGDTPHFPVPLLGREGVRARNKILRVVISREELQSAAAQLRALVSDLEVVQHEKPNLELQIGYKLLDAVITIPQCLKAWDIKSNGEITRAGIRNSLRNLGFTGLPSDGDALFDLWNLAHQGLSLPSSLPPSLLVSLRAEPPMAIDCGVHCVDRYLLLITVECYRLLGFCSYLLRLMAEDHCH